MQRARGLRGAVKCKYRNVINDLGQISIVTLTTRRGDLFVYFSTNREGLPE
jgi:hypothetical protein